MASRRSTRRTVLREEGKSHSVHTHGDMAKFTIDIDKVSVVSGVKKAPSGVL